MEKEKKKMLWFAALFIIVGLISLQVPVLKLVGSQIKFTLFDFFAPVAGAFLGAGVAVVAVLIMQLVNFFLHGSHVLDAGTWIHFLPVLGASWYFAARPRWVLVLPLVAIIAFVLNPIGRSVWYYSLFWLIPFACALVYQRFLFARALGATFTAHAIGGALWVYYFALPKAVWIALIPVVAKERLFFALGITLTYLIFNQLLYWLAEKQFKALMPLVNTQYVWNGRMKTA